MDYSFLWDDSATEQDMIDGYQALIDNGRAWQLEGSVGRTAISLIKSGLCTLGETGHYDYYGNYVPSKYEARIDVT